VRNNFNDVPKLSQYGGKDFLPQNLLFAQKFSDEKNLQRTKI